jgi:endonuclease G
MIRFILPLLVANSLFAQEVPGKGYKPIVLDSGYAHDLWVTKPIDLKYEFAAFTLSFDSDDDDNGDGNPDILGIPEWVAYEIKKSSGDSESLKRPKWMTDDDLHKEGITPDNSTYAVKGTRELSEVKTDYRFVRGHMCPKDAADRITPEAGYNTHTVLNAVPQLQWQNNGIWKRLEQQVNDWADKHEQVWVICGPVFFNDSPSMWLGEEGEVKAAIPDALFKIVVREEDNKNGVETIAYLIPNILPKEKKNPSDFVTTIDRIETLTELSFLTTICDKKGNDLKKIVGEPSEW